MPPSRITILSLARCSEPFITTIAMVKLDSGLATAALLLMPAIVPGEKRRDPQGPVAPRSPRMRLGLLHHPILRSRLSVNRPAALCGAGLLRDGAAYIAHGRARLVVLLAFADAGQRRD